MSGGRKGKGLPYGQTGQAAKRAASRFEKVDLETSTRSRHGETSRERPETDRIRPQTTRETAAGVPCGKASSEAASLRERGERVG